MTPTATLDSRYSSEVAEAIHWDRAVHRLETAEVAWLVTVRADGRPHATPVVPIWHEGRVFFQTSEPEQKYVNLRANQNVVVLVGDTGWDAGIDVVVEGAAQPVTDDVLLGAIAELYARRLDGRWQLDARDGGLTSPDREGSSRVFEVHPAKAFAHAKGDPFGQTTYTF